MGDSIMEMKNVYKSLNEQKLYYEQELIRKKNVLKDTKEERKNPKLLNGNRRLRIARGSGTTVQDINKFMKSFEMTQKMMRKMQNEKNLKKMMKGINPNDLKGMLK